MRLEKEFRAPKGINAFKTVVVRELDGNDEVQIAVWCDGKRGQPGFSKDNLTAELQLQRNEAIRCSIVSVDGKPVNVNGAPWAGYDEWPRRAKLAVGRFHDDLNGLDTADLEKCVTEGKPVNAPRNQQEGASTGGPGEG